MLEPSVTTPKRSTVARSLSTTVWCGAAFLCASAAWGASHSDAPLIKQDPQANITDVYAFVSPGGLNAVVHVRPFSEPGDGPHYDRFADDARYSIHITNPTSGETVIRYDFQFSDVNPLDTPGLKNPNTLLSYGRGTAVGPILNNNDATRNYTQAYTVKIGRTRIGIGITPPPNVGSRTTPSYNDPTTGFAISGATNVTELDAYTRDAIFPLEGGGSAFAGPREDGFYADIPGIFDLLDDRIIDNNGNTGDGLGQDGGGVDGFKGFNVLAYAIQVPIANLENVPGFPTVGVYASVSRRRVRLLSTAKEPVNTGPWVQVNRMGNPIFNEAFVALQDKDKYNRTSPSDDAASFAKYAENPELAVLLNTAFFGGGEVIPQTGRSDLAGIFIPDVLRVNTSTGPVPLAGQTGFNRLSVFGGDTTAGGPSGFPNGRRFGDDVIDIALTALAGGTVVGDNVAANDQVFHQVFPYSATPHSGAKNRKDSIH
jgi:hypothetical protein